MHNKTTRSTSLSICIPEDNEDVVLESDFGRKYIINPECQIVPSYSIANVYRALSAVSSSLRYYISYDICHKHYKQKEAIRKELESVLAGNFLLSYNIPENINTSYRSSIPNFLAYENSRTTRHGITYLKNKLDIFARNEETGVIVPVLMFANLKKALPLLLGHVNSRHNSVSNKQNIILFNDKFLKESPDKYMRSRLRQYVNNHKRVYGYSFKFVTTDFFNNMFVEVPKVGLFTSIKAIEQRKELLLNTINPVIPAVEVVSNDDVTVNVAGDTTANISGEEEIELPF